MTNADQKRAIRARMARTGESYTAAKRAIERERQEPPPEEPYDVEKGLARLKEWMNEDADG
jgi:hypothetical protein